MPVVNVSELIISVVDDGIVCSKVRQFAVNCDEDFCFVKVVNEIVDACSAINRKRTAIAVLLRLFVAQFAGDLAEQRLIESADSVFIVKVDIVSGKNV